MITVIDHEVDLHTYLGAVLALADFVEARVNEQDEALSAPFDAATGKFADPAYNALAAHLLAIDEIIARVRNRARVAKTTHTLSEVRGMAYALRAHALAYRDHADFQQEWVL